MASNIVEFFGYSPTDASPAAKQARADKQCPFVPGAALRIGLPFDDPKAFDNTPREAAMYDERCQQIARELLYVFSEAVQPQDKRVQRSAS